MRIDHKRGGNGYGKGKGNGYGNGNGDGYGDGYGNGYGNGYGYGYGYGDGYGDSASHTLYLLHPFAPLADFDAWMLHLQVEGRVRR